MTNLTRRLRKLEGQLTDTNGLVPHSEKWFDYWGERVTRIFSGQEEGRPGRIPFQVIDALLAKVRSERADSD